MGQLKYFSAQCIFLFHIRSIELSYRTTHGSCTSDNFLGVMELFWGFHNTALLLPESVLNKSLIVQADGQADPGCSCLLPFCNTNPSPAQVAVIINLFIFSDVFILEEEGGDEDINRHGLIPLLALSWSQFKTSITVINDFIPWLPCNQIPNRPVNSHVFFMRLFHVDPTCYSPTKVLA